MIEKHRLEADATSLHANVLAQESRDIQVLAFDNRRLALFETTARHGLELHHFLFGADFLLWRLRLFNLLPGDWFFLWRNQARRGFIDRRRRVRFSGRRLFERK